MKQLFNNRLFQEILWTLIVMFMTKEINIMEQSIARGVEVISISGSNSEQRLLHTAISPKY